MMEEDRRQDTGDRIQETGEREKGPPARREKGGTDSGRSHTHKRRINNQ